MKTTTNKSRLTSLAGVLFTVTTMLGTTTWAQSDAGSNTDSIDKAFERLEALMAKTEAAIRYTVSSDFDAGVYEAMERMELLAQETRNTLRYEAPQAIPDDLAEVNERLELLASKTENELRYRVPDAETATATDPGSPEYEEDQDNHHLLTFHLARVK